MILMSKLFLISLGILILSSVLYVREPDSPEEILILPYELSGNVNSKVMVVFLHGWPNTFRMWDRLVDDLKKDYLCLNISYPNFAKGVTRKWGMDLIDIVHLIKKTIEHVEIDQEQTYKHMVVSHDWGAIFNYLLDSEYPNFVSNSVAIDVGTGGDDSIKGKLFTVSYQWYLLSNFLVGGQLGKLGTKLFVDYYAKPWGLTAEDKDRLDSSWNYLYFYVWKSIGYYGQKLRDFKPSHPIAFIYGKNKDFFFHNEKFLNMIKSTKGEVIDVDDGHWLMDKHENVVLEVARRFAKNLNK